MKLGFGQTANLVYVNAKGATVTRVYSGMDIYEFFVNRADRKNVRRFDNFKTACEYADKAA